MADRLLFHSRASGVSGVTVRTPSATGGPFSFCVPGPPAFNASLRRACPMPSSTDAVNGNRWSRHKSENHYDLSAWATIPLLRRKAVTWARRNGHSYNRRPGPPQKHDTCKVWWRQDEGLTYSSTLSGFDNCSNMLKPVTHAALLWHVPRCHLGAVPC